MRVDVFVNFPQLTGFQAQLDRIESQLKQNFQQEKQMSQTLDELQAEVSRDGEVVSSAVTLLTGLTTKINELIAAGNNDPALAALRDSLKTNTDSLASAVAANTPAA